MPAAGSSLHSSVVPLRADRLRSAVVVDGSLWSQVKVVAETGSTNSDLLKLAADGAPPGLVLAARTQTSGRGRQDRVWKSAPGTALTFSVLLRPRSVPRSARGWVPLLAGVAAAAAVRSVTGVDARLKWPNDILIGDGKLTGILAEQTTGDAIVVGIGLNLRGGVGELPVPTATSLELHGAGQTDQNELLAEILRRLERWYRRWAEPESPSARPGDADACGLRPEYLRQCATIGRSVKIALPGGRSLAGTAVDVDRSGRLIVRADGPDPDLVPVSAGDVIHVRLVRPAQDAQPRAGDCPARLTCARWSQTVGLGGCHDDPSCGCDGWDSCAGTFPGLSTSFPGLGRLFPD